MKTRKRLDISAFLTSQKRSAEGRGRKERVDVMLHSSKLKKKKILIVPYVALTSKLCLQENRNKKQSTL